MGGLKYKYKEKMGNKFTKINIFIFIFSILGLFATKNFENVYLVVLMGLVVISTGFIWGLIKKIDRESIHMMILLIVLPLGVTLHGLRVNALVIPSY